MQRSRVEDIVTGFAEGHMDPILLGSPPVDPYHGHVEAPCLAEDPQAEDRLLTFGQRLLHLDRRTTPPEVQQVHLGYLEVIVTPPTEPGPRVEDRAARGNAAVGGHRIDPVAGRGIS